MEKSKLIQLLLRTKENKCFNFSKALWRNPNGAFVIFKEFKQTYNQWEFGGISAVKALQEIEVKKTTLYKLVKEFEKAMQE